MSENKRVNVGTIGHVGNGKTSLAVAIINAGTDAMHKPAATGGEVVATLHVNGVSWRPDLTYAWLAEHEGDGLVLASDLDAMRAECSRHKKSADDMLCRVRDLEVLCKERKDAIDAMLAEQESLKNMYYIAAKDREELPRLAQDVSAFAGEPYHCPAHKAAVKDFMAVVKENDALRARLEQVEGVLDHAHAWASDVPHGDNCYLHNDGGEFDTCRCGKDWLLVQIERAQEGSIRHDEDDAALAAGGKHEA